MYKDLMDGELIFNIKNNISPNECLREIVHRHSGIYLDMVNIYASDIYSTYITLYSYLSQTIIEKVVV